MPSFVEAREIIAEFHMMIRRKAAAGLRPWIERARASLVASFADHPPQARGRQMYGRGSVRKRSAGSSRRQL